MSLLSSFRRWRVPIAVLTLALFYHATLHAHPALAQPNAGSAPESDTSGSAQGSYDASAMSDLSGQVAAEGGGTAPGAETAEVGEIDEDMPRALAALPKGGGSVSPQATSLPKGAATSLGMGESFTTQLSTGMAAFSVPLSLPGARGGAQPKIELSYNSGGGSGIAGMGWSIGASAISRQTDRGVPQYDDRSGWHPNQDRFVFGGMELVPICTVSGGGCSGKLPDEVMPVWADGWQYFRARVEGGYLRFFWSPDHLTWRVQSKDGANLELGVPLDGSGYEGGLESNPDDADEIYRWHLVRQYDSQGDVNNTSAPNPVNAIVYRYFHDGNTVYLSDVYDTSPASNPTTQDLTTFAHHTHLSYEARPDIGISYRPGWRVEYGLRLASVDVTSKPFEGSIYDARQLLHRYRLSYDPTSHTSLLTHVQLEGRCEDPVLEDADGLLPATTCPRLPGATFEYERVEGDSAPLQDLTGYNYEPFDERVRELANSPPHSLDEALTGLMDVNGDGLKDVLVTAPGLFDGNFGVFFNGRSPEGTAGFEGLATMSVVGGSADAGILQRSNSNVTTLDLDSDGVVNLAHVPNRAQYSIYEPEQDEGGQWSWQGHDVITPDGNNPKIDFTSNRRDIRVMDVNADGLVDVVYSSPTEIQTFFSLGRYPGGEGLFGQGTWTGPDTADLSGEPVRRCAPWSAQPVRFSDPDTRVADMNGDGLADIVRVRSGQILYWPGRGNGFWGTGGRKDCLGGDFAVDRHIEMQDAPRFGTAQPGTLLLNDVNGDGYSDMVEVRNQGVDIYLNDSGYGWTRRHIIDDTPFRPSASNYVRLADVDGSGTPDILWGRAHEYKYIDLTGGERPHLLKKVSNGLGKTLELEYDASTQVMLDAEAAGDPWESTSPAVTPVLTRSVVKDNLEKIGRAPGAYVTQYSYRDPVYEGRQREFRGFREAVVRKVGDANSPTSLQRHIFQLGECDDESGLPEDACSFGNLWRSNWREALKGLPVLTESYDENGTYLSTNHTSFQLKQLYSGLDGRRVVVALPTVKNAFIYDTAEFDGAQSSVTIDEIDVVLDGIQHVETRAVPKRASAGTARVRSQTIYDDFGNVIESVQEGCVEGCPAHADGSTVDETIITHSDYQLPQNDGSGWLWRERRSYVTGSQHTQRRQEVVHDYNQYGDVEESRALLSGTLELDRFHEAGAAIAPTPAGASGGIDTAEEILVQHTDYDALGNATLTRSAENGCARKEHDVLYASLPTTARVYAGKVGADGCGQREFVHQVRYDRGLAAVTDSTDATGQPTHYEYDGFGRLKSTTLVDPDNPGSLAAYPAQTIEYRLPTDAQTRPYSTVIVRTQDAEDANASSYREVWTFKDGLGRSLAKLSQADPGAGDEGQWVSGGAVEYDGKGAKARMYDPWFYDGSPQEFDLGSIPTHIAAAHEFDAFGRTLDSYDHGVHVQHVDHHAMSQDIWDAGDLATGDHQGTYMSVLSDGHGRGLRSTERVRVDGTLEERHTFTDYLTTGEVERVLQRKAGAADVVRWMKYDSLGRMVLNVEPNTTANFHPDPATPPDTLQAWRYRYNDAGDMVGVSDARGCGANYHYDAGGRLLAEDRSPCLEHHVAYSPPDLSTGEGTEVFYRYDVADPNTGSIADAAGRPFEIDTSLLWGSVASISDVGSQTVFSYDARGRTREVAARTVKPGDASTTLSSRYAPRWYTRQFELDAAGRTLSASTGATTPELLGTNGESKVSFSYTKRGVTEQATSSYGTLLQSSTYDANGQLQQMTLGDAASTQRSYTYDERHRTEMVMTARANPSLWSNPPEGSNYTAPTDTAQLLLEEYHFDYDASGNITEIVDNRVASEWPDHAQPVTRRFKYDDRYRLTEATYSYPSGAAADTWKSPYDAENNDPSRVQPSPHVDFDTRVKEQSYQYDHLGNLEHSGDDRDGFWDRSLGDVEQGPNAWDGPHQIRSASNRGSGTAPDRQGDLVADYDPAGNLTDLIVKRDGPCLPTGASCWQRFHYRWDELGQLDHARRWDLAASPYTEREDHDALNEPLPSRPPDAELRYSYDGGGDRVLKTAVDENGAEKHTVYIFGPLELRSTVWDADALQPDYVMDAHTAVVRISGGGVTGRVLYSEEDLPDLSSGNQHFFLELSDHLGSTTFIIDHETSELVEYATYQAYGAAESDYRPGRWDSFREDYRFSGKEEDIEVGLQYFGARFYSPYLQQWMSPDPVTIHDLEGDPNPYAYVHGTPLMGVDPDGRFAILSAIAVGAAIGLAVGAGTSIAVQGITNGWSNIDWGINGVLGAAVTGAVSGAVGAGVGGAISSGIGGAGGAILGASAGGASAGGASYATNYAMTGQGDWAGFGLAMAAGAIGGLAGGSLGSVPGMDTWWGGLISGGAGAASGGGFHAAVSGHFDAVSFAISIGTGAAIAAARNGVQNAARSNQERESPSLRELAADTRRGPDPFACPRMGGCGASQPIAGRGKVAVRAARVVSKLAGKWHKHHTVPKEILNKFLPKKVANHPLVRGKAGSPNRWSIPAEKHMQLHKGPGGGAWNDAWKAKIRALGRTPNVKDVVRIRGELVKEFGLEAYRPTSITGKIGSALLQVLDLNGNGSFGAEDILDFMLLAPMSGSSGPDA